MATTRRVSDEEYLALLEHCRGAMAIRDKCLLVQLRAWGPRISEALSLRVGQVLDHGQVQHEVAIEARHVKTGKGYIAPLNEDARWWLARWLSEAQRHGHMAADSYVFHVRGCSRRPMTPLRAWKIIQQAKAAARLPGCIGPHSLRKSYGWQVYRASGNDIMAAKEALRHESVESTRKYLAIDAERVKPFILRNLLAPRE